MKKHSYYVIVSVLLVTLVDVSKIGSRTEPNTSNVSTKNCRKSLLANLVSNLVVGTYPIPNEQIEGQMLVFTHTLMIYQLLNELLIP